MTLSGLYPGFFLFFMSVPILTFIERYMREKINPMVIPGYDFRKPMPPGVVPLLYWFVCWFGTNTATHYLAAAFNSQSFEKCMAIWGSYHNIPHLVSIVFLLFLVVLPGPKRDKDAAKQKTT
jgi:hypothetical protein